MERAFSFHAHVRDRILPALADLDGLSDQLPEVLRTFDTLADRDLDYDLREEPPFRSNLCEQSCAIELAYTFGGDDDCGVRYSFEPTCPPGRLRNRYTLCRDRVREAMNAAGDGYDASLFRRLFKAGVPNDILLSGDDATATICAVHHYKDRPPRLKMYFSVDYADEPRALEQIRALVGELDAPLVEDAVQSYLDTFDPPGGGRMVGFDFEPDRPTSAKVYKMGAGLDEAALATLVDRCEGGRDAHNGLAAFRRLFLGDDSTPTDLNLVAIAPSATKPPRLKIYLRPVDLYDDGETLARLRRWYEEIDRSHELALVERGLAAVAPLDVLGDTRGFFNYLSVDVGPGGLSKTSVYFAPLIPLARLARSAPDRLPSLPR